jgi:type II secretion system protein N
MRRVLGIAALVVAVFGVVGALTFPTDAVVQAALDRVPLPDGMTATFATARLRPSGLRLEQVHVARIGGDPVFDAEWLRLRPSPLGFWRDGTGRPWSIGAGACQGTVELAIDADRQATPIAAELEDVDLASCLPYVLPRVDAYGRVSGRVNLRLDAVEPNASEGSLELRGAAWKPGGPLEDLPLRADGGTLAWTLAERRLQVTTIDAWSSDFRAVGRGMIRFLEPADDSVLDFRVAVTPGPSMPPLLRQYFDGIPGSPPGPDGTRTFRIGGSLREPRVIAILTQP